MYSNDQSALTFPRPNVATVSEHLLTRRGRNQADAEFVLVKSEWQKIGIAPDFSTELVDNSEGKVAVTNPLCRHYRGFIEMPKS